MFLDTSEISWQYEIEGFRLDTDLGRIQYLPDFYLPRARQWAEVKGHFEQHGCERICAVATTMCQCGDYGSDIVVLGNIPRPDSARWPIQLHAHGQDLFVIPWELEPGCPLGRPYLRVRPAELLAAALTEGMLAGHPDWAVPGLVAARAARFEFGESG